MEGSIDALLHHECLSTYSFKLSSLSSLSENDEMKLKAFMTKLAIQRSTINYFTLSPTFLNLKRPGNHLKTPKVAKDKETTVC